MTDVRKEGGKQIAVRALDDLEIDLVSGGMSTRTKIVLGVSFAISPAFGLIAAYSYYTNLQQC